MQNAVYLDNNASTPIAAEVLERMRECWCVAFGNPGSPHAFGREARRVLEESRESIADILNADPSEVIFTSGGTESLNTAITGFIAGRRGLIALTAGEHPAVRQSVVQACLNGCRSVDLPLDSNGYLDESFLAALNWPDVRLVCVLLGHNETGVIQRTDVVAEYCRVHRVPLLLDTVQAIGRVPVDFRASGAAAMALAAHKFHGPRGVGALLLRTGCRIAPLLHGGHQEAGRRAGTEPVALAAGMAKALELWKSQEAERTRVVTELRDHLERRLREQCAPVIVHGEKAVRLPNTLSISFPGVRGEPLLVNLHLAGIACSLGSACASGSAEPAPVLIAMGQTPEVARSSVRFSLSCHNTRDEIDYAIGVVRETVQRLRAGVVR